MGNTTSYLFSFGEDMLGIDYRNVGNIVLVLQSKAVCMGSIGTDVRIC